jgi:hypothetical protein
MARCVECGISGKNNKPLCWSKYQMCMQCCAKKYPFEYPESVVLKALSHQAIKASERRIKICETCAGTIKILAFHGNGRRVTIKAGYCPNCAKICLYDDRLRTEVMV